MFNHLKDIWKLMLDLMDYLLVCVNIDNNLIFLVFLFLNS